MKAEREKEIKIEREGGGGGGGHTLTDRHREDSCERGKSIVERFNREKDAFYERHRTRKLRERIVMHERDLLRKG